MKTKGQFTLFTVEEFAHWLRNNDVDREVVRIQNHHTWQPGYDDFNGRNHFELVEGMKRYHERNNGWADIGQNLTTFPDGTVAICRSLERVPACIYRANHGSVCVEHLGNFDRGRDVMTPAHRRCIVMVNALLCREFGLDVSDASIVYHHWYDLSTGERTSGRRNKKSCPGSAFFGGNSVASCVHHFLPRVRAAMEEIEGATPVPGPVNVPVATVRVLARDGRLAIRGGPRTSYPRLGTLPDGAVVQLYEARGIWRRIDPDASRWVSSRYLVPG